MMEKITFRQENIDNTELVERLKKEPLITQLFHKYNIPYVQLERTPLRFLNWLETVQKCEKCTGLSHCTQPSCGQYKDLVYNGFLQPVLRDCRYQRDLNDKTGHMANYVVNDLPEHLQTVSFSTINIDQENDDYVRVVSKLMKSLEDRGVYLYGDVGVGKTYLAACAANRLAKENRKVAFVHVPSFTARIKNGVRTGEHVNEITDIRLADFVVMDDIGAESCSAWVRDEVLMPILNWRMEHHKLTWFTSNEDQKSLHDHFALSSGNREEEMKAVRLMERISTLAEYVYLSGKNRRKKA